MEDLYTIQPSNKHAALVLRDSSAWGSLSAKLNRNRLTADWRSMEIDLFDESKGPKILPDLGVLYVPGAVAIRSDIKDAVFGAGYENLEFLPVRVAQQDWFLVNCLQTVSEFDESSSKVSRGLSGEIFMVLWLVVTDSDALRHEVFTLDSSNRASVFVKRSFKERVESLGLQGITFRKIGQVVSQLP